jgi:hypothetical protein
MLESTDVEQMDNLNENYSQYAKYL